MEQNKEELLKHLAASLEDAKSEGGAILLVGAGISVSAGIPPAQKLMKIAIENFPNYFTQEEQELAQQDINRLQYNDIMTKLSNVKRKELFRWFIEGNDKKGIKKAKLNFAHILENDEESKVIYGCDADETFMEIAELLGCSLDFIESPEAELKRYLNEINFYSAKYQRGIIYKNLIEQYINLLSNDPNIKKLQNIKNIETILNQVLTCMYNFIIEDNPKLENLDQNISLVKQQYEEHKITDILETYCYGLCRKYQITKDINNLKEEIEYAVQEAHIYKDASPTLRFQIIRLYCISQKVDLALSELQSFPKDAALERKEGFLANNELKILRNTSEYQNWFFSTFNEKLPD